MRAQRGFTLAETLLAMALVAVGVDTVYAKITSEVEQSRIQRAAQDLTAIERVLEAYRQVHHELPATLAELGTAVPLDPWGHPYEYVNFEFSGTAGQRTFDGLPINSDYDLYSRGADGRTEANLRTEAAHDDIVRARDGAYVGPAADF
jgi:general secretion pathway protein G